MRTRVERWRLVTVGTVAVMPRLSRTAVGVLGHASAVHIIYGAASGLMAVTFGNDTTVPSASESLTTPPRILDAFMTDPLYRLSTEGEEDSL